MSPEPIRTTVYQQIADHIESQILAGELADGDRLPSLTETRTAWGVSADTARRAVDLLRVAGLVVVRQGAPTVVSAPRTVPAPAVVAEALGVAEGQPVRMAVGRPRSVTLTLID